MPEWVVISQIDKNIHANRSEKKRTEEEIEFLQSKLQNYDKEYANLRSQKQLLGKEIYGDPGVRGALVEDGLKCSNARVKQAAQRLREQDTDIKWDMEVREELINICMYIDARIHPISNWNIRRILYKIGKFGYGDIDNSEGSI